MSSITTTGRVTESFDAVNLSATYVAEHTPDGGVQISIDVFDGAELVATIPRRRFSADEVDGFIEH